MRMERQGQEKSEKVLLLEHRLQQDSPWSYIQGKNLQLGYTITIDIYQLLQSDLLIFYHV